MCRARKVQEQLPRQSVNKYLSTTQKPAESTLIRLTSRRTTLSKASSAEILALTCAESAFHHDGDEKRCMIATVQRSRSTGGITVGSAIIH